MSDATLIQAETLHRLLGDACIALGLRARYLGALAYPVKEGASPDVSPAIWAITLPPDPGEPPGLELVGERLFRASLASAGGAGPEESWDVELNGATLQLHIFDVTAIGRPYLDPLKQGLVAS